MLIENSSIEGTLQHIIGRLKRLENLDRAHRHVTHQTLRALIIECGISPAQAISVLTGLLKSGHFLGEGQDFIRSLSEEIEKEFILNSIRKTKQKDHLRIVSPPNDPSNLS